MSRSGALGSALGCAVFCVLGEDECVRRASARDLRVLRSRAVRPVPALPDGDEHAGEAGRPDREAGSAVLIDKLPEVVDFANGQGGICSLIGMPRLPVYSAVQKFRSDLEHHAAPRGMRPEHDPMNGGYACLSGRHAESSTTDGPGRAGQRYRPRRAGRLGHPRPARPSRHDGQPVRHARDLGVGDGLERRAPVLGNDGYAIAREILTSNTYQNQGVFLARDAGKMAKRATGDGSTTAIVLSDAMVRRGLRAVRAGYEPIAVSRGMEAAAALLCRLLEIAFNARVKRRELEVVGRQASGDAEIGEAHRRGGGARRQRERPARGGADTSPASRSTSTIRSRSAAAIWIPT